MGTINHDCVIFEGSDGYGRSESWLDAVQKVRDRMHADDGADRCLLGPVTVTNGTTIVVLIPDGSKEGWDQSDRMDEWRQELIDAVLAFPTFQRPRVIHLSWGELTDDRVKLAFDSEWSDFL